MPFVFPGISTNTVNERTLDSGVTVDGTLLKNSKVVYLNLVQNTKSNFIATAAPTVNNDVTESYTPGSIWIDTTANITYMCTKNTTGAAVWKKISKESNIAHAESVMSTSTTGSLYLTHMTLNASLMEAGTYICLYHFLIKSWGSGFKIRLILNGNIILDNSGLDNTTDTRTVSAFTVFTLSSSSAVAIDLAYANQLGNGSDITHMRDAGLMIWKID